MNRPEMSRIRISVLQPPASGLGGKSWQNVWNGNNSIRAILALLIALSARNGRSIRVDWSDQ